MERRCGNCIHKNVCELYDIVQDPTHAVGCGNFLDTADVVPRSEVEEIFEEIEFEIHQLDFDRDETRAIAIEGIIANAKKKYTEEGG